VLFDQETWDKKVRDQGEATISCQMLANPLAGHQRMFNVEDLRVYEVRPETLAVYILIDPARSKKTDSDATAMAVIGVDYAQNKYLLDGYNHKMDLMERWEHTARLYLKWKSAPGVQATYVGYESFGAQADLDYFREQQKLTAVRFEIAELAWPREGGGSKVDRVQRLGPDFRGHKFYIPYPTDEKNYTSLQRKMLDGYKHRIAAPIRRKSENNEIYDLTDHFKMQVHYFPFGGKKDLVDAVSRIYDMDVRPPTYREQRYAEPEYV
jgi:phage terminase large subunit-like protein